MLLEPAVHTSNPVVLILRVLMTLIPEVVASLAYVQITIAPLIVLPKPTELHEDVILVVP